MSNCKIRVGQGYDVHRLVEGRPLILGGVQIPHSLGLDRYRCLVRRRCHGRHRQTLSGHRPGL